MKIRVNSLPCLAIEIEFSNPYKISLEENIADGLMDWFEKTLPI